MPIEPKKRQTAYKVWIKDIVSGDFVKGAGWEPSYVLVGNKQISRANLLATVVSKFASEDGNYASVTLDDGTETIRAKAFGPDVAKLAHISVGALVRFICRVKHYNEETYLAPEAAHLVEDPNWVIVQKLELGEPVTGMPKPEDVKPEISEKEAEEIIIKDDETMQAKIINIIRSLDSGEGASTDAVISSSELEEEDAKKILTGLLSSGDIYEPKKGMLKVLG